MQSLRLANACLAEIPDLTMFRIEELDIQGNRLFAIEGLPPMLKTLNCSHNSILGDGLSQPLLSLEDLDIQHNRINIFDNEEFVQNFPSLKRLNISHNSLKHTSFLLETQIEEVYLSQNRLLLISGLPQTLKKLIADTNKISMVQSKLPPLLEQIDLPYNELRFAGLPMAWPSNLRELHLDHNAIEKFPRKLPDSLEILTLSENRITHLPEVLPESLQILIVSSNRIRFLPSYKNHKRFKVLLINNNCLTHATAEANSVVFSDNKCWNLEKHHDAQKHIRKSWRRYVLGLRLRHIYRTKQLQTELFSISMMPDRWQQIDTYDPIWFRKHSRHNHTDLH